MIMNNRTTRHFGHSSSPARGHMPGRRLGARRPDAAEFPAALSRQGVWDRALDGSAPKVTPIHHLRLHLLDIIVRLGIALFITAGFSAGLCLYTGTTLYSPYLVRACGGVFLWTLAVISCVTSRGS
jgi:hypothetical protein